VKKKRFIKFYDKYSKDIYRFVYLKTNSAEDSEDITSETFLQFWKTLQETSKKVENHRALLYKMATNLVNDFFRKKTNSEIKKEPSAYEFQNVRANINPAKNAEIDSEMEAIRTALNRIKRKHQNVIIWYYLNELSYKEIAYIMDKSEGNVRVLVHRAMKELKKLLNG
jgi:RNA polymerase sigma-70 factor (ECF subfamily)